MTINKYILIFHRVSFTGREIISPRHVGAVPRERFIQQTNNKKTNLNNNLKGQQQHPASQTCMNGILVLCFINVASLFTP